MPGSRKQSENFLEFLKIPFSNRSESTRSYVYLHLDPDGWPVVEVATLCGEHMRRTRPVHNQNHSHSWRQRAARSERNGKVKGEFSWFKSVFFEGIRLWEQQDQLLRKSSQIKLLKMLLESKKINKQLVIVVCQSLIGACFFWGGIRLRLNFAENPIFSICVFVETDLVWNEIIQVMFLYTLRASK